MGICAADLFKAEASPQFGQGRVYVAGHGVAQKAEELEDRGFSGAVRADDHTEIRQIGQFGVLERFEIF